MGINQKEEKMEKEKKAKALRALGKSAVGRDVGMEDWKAKANVPDAHLRTVCGT